MKDFFFNYISQINLMKAKKLYDLNTVIGTNQFKNNLLPEQIE